MKTKSSYHRSTNTYKFQTFSERISNINIDVIRKGGRTEQQPEDADSFFAAGLAKWTDLNCTQDFGNFTSDISGQVDSFAQLVHHEDEIITALKKHLQKKGSLAHQPLLDLLVQLARDLQTDFYPHFPDFFHIIVSLLNTQDTELLENAFRAFGYLFKFLWRYLVRDIHDVFRLYSPLLADSQRDHIRNFAAESFAFLMRKVKDHDALFNMMLARLEENPDQSTGFGRLFFEMIKGVKTQFHSCTEKVLPILLSKLGPIQASVESTCQLPWQLVLETLQAVFEFMAEWTSPEHAGVIGNVLKSCVSAMHKLFTAEADTDRKVQIADQLDRLLALTTQWIGHHSGYLIKQPDTYADVLLTLLEGSILPGQCGDTLLDLTAALLNASQCDIRNDVITHLVRSVFSSHYSQLQVLGFSQQLFSMRSFEKDILHPLLHFCHTGIGSKSTSSNHDILHTLCSLVLHKQSSTTDGSVLESNEPYLMDFSFDVYKSQSKSKKNKKRADNFPEYLLSLLEFSPDLLRQDNVVSVLWAALVCLPSTRPLDKARVVPKLNSLITTLGNVAENQKDKTVKDMLLYLLSVAVCSLLQCGQGQPMQSLVQEDFVWNILRTNPTCVHALLIGDLYITQLVRDQDGSFLAADKLKLIFPALQPNLSSPHKKVQTLTLRILSQFPVKLSTIPDLHTRQVCVFKLCLEAELVPANVEDYREKRKLLQ